MKEHGKRKTTLYIFMTNTNYKSMIRDFRSQTCNKTVIIISLLKTDKNSSLKDKHIEIQYIYDFDSKLEDIKLKMELTDDFSLQIPFKDIPNHNLMASIRFKYILPNGEERYNYITESRFANKKEKDLPNVIAVTFVEQPKTEVVYRVTKGVLEDDKIKIVSTEKSKTDLFDYTKKIEFKAIYEKQVIK